MSVLKLLFTGIFLWLEKFKGRRRVKEITPPSTSVFTLTVEMIAGYEITIHCHKRVYRQEYARWFIPGRDHANFLVSATVPADAPAKLKRACEMEVNFPPFFSELVTDEVQKKLAINAYLDLLKEAILRMN